MTEPSREFPPDAYVVRYGGRAVLGTLAGLLGCTVVLILVVASGRPVITDAIVGFFEVGLLIAFITDLAKAAKREVVFAVHHGGVYFGSDLVKDDVPWQRICAVEFFTEATQNTSARTSYQCVGVRAPGTRQTARQGNGAAAAPVQARSAQYLIDAGRPDLLPGADGTIRYVYRKMKGWRADRVKVAEAVARYAPAIPVINGQDWPTQISSADASGVRRRRRPGF